MGFLSRVRSAVVSIASDIVAQAATKGVSKPLIDDSPAIINNRSGTDTLPSASLPERTDVIVSSHAPPALTVTKKVRPDQFELLRLLGKVPVERPYYQEYGPKESDEAPTGALTTQLLNDNDFSAHLLLTLVGEFVGSPMYIDLATQLPAYNVGTTSFYSSISTYGRELTHTSPFITDVDRELATLGWVRYVAHTFGPKTPAPNVENVEAAGTMWEGFVPIILGSDSADTVKLVASVLVKHEVDVIMQPEVAIKNGLPFSRNDKPSPWFIIYLSKPLTRLFLDR